MKRFVALTLLTALLALGTRLPAGAENPAKAKSPLVEALQPFVESQSLAGAVVLVANRERTLALEAVGWADIAGKKPMQTDAVVWIASMTKPITGTALMLLVEEGKVKLDDPVEKYLPEFKDIWLAVEQDKEHILLKRPTKTMTVRHLMNHTSGMVFKSALEQPTLDLSVLRDNVRSYTMTPLHSEPGTKFLYSNAGINTAGRIIEVVSGMSYEDFLHKRLFEPLGMKDTSFWLNDEQLKRLPRVYKPNAAKNGLEATTNAYLKAPFTDRQRQPMPGGGLFSTASDLGKFCQMVLNGGTFQGKRYLSEESVKEMTTRKMPAEMMQSFGVGWQVNPGNFGHGGAFATNMTIDTQRGLVLIYLVQHNGFANDGSKALAAFRKAAEEQHGAANPAQK